MDLKNHQHFIFHPIQLTLSRYMSYSQYVTPLRKEHAEIMHFYKKMHLS
jgi:hypothetical protein